MQTKAYCRMKLCRAMIAAVFALGCFAAFEFIVSNNDQIVKESGLLRLSLFKQLQNNLHLQAQSLFESDQDATTQGSTVLFQLGRQQPHGQIRATTSSDQSQPLHFSSFSGNTTNHPEPHGSSIFSDLRQKQRVVPSQKERGENTTTHQSSYNTSFLEGHRSVAHHHSRLEISSLEQEPGQEVRRALQQQQSEKVEEIQRNLLVTDQDPNCEVPNAADVAVRNPMWTASYPGSGAKLMWKLIRATTGIFTSDDHDHDGRIEQGTIVAVKTHFPSHTDPDVFTQDKFRHISRAILLIRNPLHSIPSYHSFVYEQQNGLLGHSLRAPIEAWIKWRNDFFEQELRTWIGHQKYWLDGYPREQDTLHLVAMEHLASQERGPDVLEDLCAFLARDERAISDSMVPVERIPCIWDMFVHGKVPGERERLRSQRSKGPKEYPFTWPQLDQMVHALLDLKRRYQIHHDLGQIMDEYIFQIEERKTRIQQL